MLMAKEEARQKLGDGEQEELQKIKDGQKFKMKSKREENPEAFHSCRRNACFTWKTQYTGQTLFLHPIYHAQTSI